jgi:hypothetical protein
VIDRDALAIEGDMNIVIHIVGGVRVYRVSDTTDVWSWRSRRAWEVCAGDVVVYSRGLISHMSHAGCPGCGNVVGRRMIENWRWRHRLLRVYWEVRDMIRKPIGCIN